jgi:hypothetical protein
MTRLNDSDLPLSLLQFCSTAPYPCSYLPDRQSVSQVAIPPQLITAGIYSDLVRRGFRRSGDFTYRPACERCHACVPVRVPVDRFVADRSQRRCLKAHGGLEAKELPLSIPPNTITCTAATRPGGMQAAEWIWTIASSTRSFSCKARSTVGWSNFVTTASCAWSASSTSSTTVFVGLHLLRSRSPRRQPGHLQHPLADQPVLRQQSAPPLSRLLDPRLPENELQGAFPPDGRAHQRPLAGNRSGYNHPARLKRK